MKKRTKRLLILAAALLLAGLWVWRYVTLNAYYNSFGAVEVFVYRIGDIVPFENDRIGGYHVADGYSICIDDFEVVDYDGYLQSSGITLEKRYMEPEKIALVYVTLINEGGDAEGVLLTDLQLHGIDNYVGMDWDILFAANPILESNPGIRLPQNAEVSLVLPYDVPRDYFGGYTWRHLDSYDWYMLLTSWPVQKEIRLS